MSDLRQEAISIARSVYEAFMREVVEAHVLDDRVGKLSDKKQKQVDSGRDVDTRVPRLMTISGKGGWSADPELAARYAESTNVTLLDHLLSLVRGSLTFAALDTLAANPDLDRKAFRADLRALAAIAFVHDLDKDLQLPRDTALTPEQVAERWASYGLDEFVGADRPLAADQVLSLIERVEDSQAHRSPPATPAPRQLRQLVGYVALADKLDGLWLKEGIGAVLERLHKDDTLRTDLLTHWHLLDLFDPHHPFLLDELQRFLSAECVQTAQLPPLIEVHQDGRLVMLIPAEHADEIKAIAFKKLCQYLSRHVLGLRIDVSNRGTPQIMDAAPDHNSLSAFISSDAMPEETLGNLFRLKVELANEKFTSRLDDLLEEVGLSPRWQKLEGGTRTPYPFPAALSDSGQDYLRQAAHVAVLLNHKQAKQLRPYSDREKALVDITDTVRPEWIEHIVDDASRRTVTALWVTRLSRNDEDMRNRIWGDAGLLSQWLDGTEEALGLKGGLRDTGKEKVEAVAAHFESLLLREGISPISNASKFCIFTGIPVAVKERIEEKDGLGRVNVSAFSGRDGRVESLDAVKGETHLSSVSYAEYRLRAYAKQPIKRRDDHIPVTLSSPSTTGLFAALALNNERDLSSLSVYDLAREQESTRQVYRGFEAYRHRYRVARFERMPERTKDQVDLLHLLLRAALRIGRPLHLFRGLPTPERAFFAYDAMPRRLAELIGGGRLRLEQIPTALERLDTAKLLLGTNGLGFEVFDRYTRPATRLGAVCLARAVLHDQAVARKVDRSARFRREFEQLMEEQSMSESDARVVALGRAAAKIQRFPGGMASANLELLTFNLSLETAIAAWKLKQRDSESLAMAIAGELETNLVRRQQQSARATRDDVGLAKECLAFARQFVADLWFGVLDGRPPAQANRRVLAAIYRMSFLTAPRAKSEAEPETDDL